MRIASDVFGLLPAPPVPQIGSTDPRLPDELTRLIRELEELLDEAKTTTASTSRDDKSVADGSGLANRLCSLAPDARGDQVMLTDELLVAAAFMGAVDREPQAHPAR